MQMWSTAALVAGLAACGFACGGPDPASHEGGRPQPVTRTLEATIDAKERLAFVADDEQGHQIWQEERR